MRADCLSSVLASRGWCNIQYGAVIGWVNGRILAVDPNPPPPSSQSAQAVATVSASHVLPDGTLETRLSDGSVRRRLPTGGTETILPDGRKLEYKYINVQQAGPPPLPLPPAYANWERSLGDRLLTVLQNVLTPAEVNAYLATEAGKNPGATDRLASRERPVSDASEFLNGGDFSCSSVSD